MVGIRAAWPSREAKSKVEWNWPFLFMWMPPLLIQPKTVLGFFFQPHHTDGLYSSCKLVCECMLRHPLDCSSEICFPYQEWVEISQLIVEMIVIKLRKYFRFYEYIIYVLYLPAKATFQHLIARLSFPIKDKEWKRKRQGMQSRLGTGTRSLCAGAHLQPESLEDKMSSDWPRLDSAHLSWDTHIRIHSWERDEPGLNWEKSDQLMVSVKFSVWGTTEEQRVFPFIPNSGIIKVGSVRFISFCWYSCTVLENSYHFSLWIRSKTVYIRSSR